MAGAAFRRRIRAGLLDLLRRLRLLQRPFPLRDVQPLAGHIVGELLLAELVLILLLGKGVVELLLRQAVLILFLLHLLVPRGVGAVGLVIAVVGVDVVPGVQQRTGQRAEARGAGDQKLHRIAHDAQRRDGIVEPLLLLGRLLLFLLGIVTVQGVQAAQVVLIPAVILLVGAVVGAAQLFKLGVIIRKFLVVQPLRVLFLRAELVQPSHKGIAAAVVGVQCQLVQGRDGQIQRPDLLLVRLLGHAGRVAGAVAAGQRRRLCRCVRAGVVGVLGVDLCILVVKRVIDVIVAEVLLPAQVVQRRVDPVLIFAFIVAGAVLLQFLQGIARRRHALRGAVPRRGQRVLHLLSAVQPLGGIGSLLFVVRHRFSFLLTGCAAWCPAHPIRFQCPDWSAHIAAAPASGRGNSAVHGHPPGPCCR